MQEAEFRSKRLMGSAAWLRAGAYVTLYRISKAVKDLSPPIGVFNYLEDKALGSHLSTVGCHGRNNKILIFVASQVSRMSIFLRDPPLCRQQWRGAGRKGRQPTWT
jgi:hypothetical protein